MLVLGGHTSQAERCERPNGTASFQLTLLTRSQGPSQLLGFTLAAQTAKIPHRRPLRYSACAGAALLTSAGEVGQGRAIRDPSGTALVHRLAALWTRQRLRAGFRGAEKGALYSVTLSPALA